MEYNRLGKIFFFGKYYLGEQTNEGGINGVWGGPGLRNEFWSESLTGSVRLREPSISRSIIFK